MVHNCTRDAIRNIDKMRKDGYTWREIGEEVGAGQGAVNRWHRLYIRYGEEAFVNA
jgi:uncharacterized protein YerC